MEIFTPTETMVFNSFKMNDMSQLILFKHVREAPKNFWSSSVFTCIY